MPAPALELHHSIITLKGVGPAIQQRLAKLGIVLIQDCLFHLPNRYIDRTQIRHIGSVVAGEVVLIQGEITQTHMAYGKRRQLLCHISDDTGGLVLRFFHFTHRQKNQLLPGKTLRCWGKVRSGRQSLELAHPEYQMLAKDKEEALDKTLTPVYPATEGISQFKLRALSTQALHVLRDDARGLPELVPQHILKKYTFSTLAESLCYVHRPPVDADTDALLQGRHKAQKRLAFEELLAHQLSLRSLRANIKQKQAHAIASGRPPAIEQFIAGLNFTLTQAQARVIDEVVTDMSKEKPMLRLLQGDVGCGKTVIAALAALYVIHAGYKVALMAPTEILCDQHFTTISQWFAALAIPVVLLKAKQTEGQRQHTLNRLTSPQPLLAIGTHALFQEHVSITQLALVIIDEQHRFGVHQRLTLMEKGSTGNHYPHQLVMTATPIPRTLAMTLFAELDISVIDALPPGRVPINTTVLSNRKRADIIQRVDNICRAGRQVYWVCASIENSEAVDLEPAEEIAALLTDSLPARRIALVHGRMKSSEKEQIMQAFKLGEIDLLVATTVIEVGVDVANANLMVIENAERLGLSQLHQLRGRVGRGAYESHCVLLYKAPLSNMAKARLSTLRDTHDGFLIAEKDLQLRGPGELSGSRQTGLPVLKIADFARDAEQLPLACDSADDMLKNTPETANKLIKRWLNYHHDFVTV